MGFFDKLKDGLEQGVNTISTKSKELVDTTKVKFDIDALQKQEKAVFEDIGKMVYGMISEGAIDEGKIKEKCELVTTLNNQIKEKEQELAQIQNKA